MRKNTAQRFQVPPGFSGWWCVRKCGAVEIDDTLGSPARCPKCHKPTAVWIPPGTSALTEAPPAQPASKREQAAEVRALSAGPGYERKTPPPARLQELFQHMKAVVEHPETEPDLRKLEEEQAKR